MSDSSTIQGNFTRVPNAFFDQWMPALKPSESVLYLFMNRRITNTDRGRNNGGYALSLPILEDRTGLSRATVWAGVKALVAYGLIEREPGSGQNADFFRIPPIPDGPSRRGSDSNSKPVDLRSGSEFKQLPAESR